MEVGEEKKISTKKRVRPSKAGNAAQKKKTTGVVEEGSREDDNEGVGGSNTREPSKKRGRPSRKTKEGCENAKKTDGSQFERQWGG